MAVTINYPIDPIQLDQLSDAGYTHLTLWYANSPDGSYANSSATVDPTTIALMISGEDYVATMTYGNGNAAQWFKVLAYNGSTYSSLSDSIPFHGGGGTTLAVLRQQLGEEMYDWRTGTLTASSDTNTGIFTDGSADVIRAADDYFNAWFWNNTTRGAWSTVSDWTRSTKTAELNTTITSQATGDTVELTRRFSPDAYRKAINYAISAAFPVLHRPIIQTGVMSVDQTFQYDVTNDIRQVTSVELESSLNLTTMDQAKRGHPFVQAPYRVLREGLQQKIEFTQIYTPERRFRIMGIGSLSQLYNDSDYVEVIDPQTDLIIYLAAFRLYNGLVNQANASSDVDRYQGLAQHYRQRAEEIKSTYTMPRAPKRLWGEEARNAEGSRRGLFGSWDPSSGAV